MNYNTIGEVTIVKRDINTGEEISTTEYNTQLNGMLRNLSTVSSPVWGTNNSPTIYIMDDNNVLTRFSDTLDTTGRTFSVGGASISGEFWPQYSVDTANNRSVYTFKQRFMPPASGSRTINTIALYPPSYSVFLAALRLQTPCIQTNTDILDVYYKLYVYIDAAAIPNNRNVNSPKIVDGNMIPRWFFYNTYPLYYEGTSTQVVTGSNSSTYYDYIGVAPVDYDLRTMSCVFQYNSDSYSSNYVMFPIYTSPTTNTLNATQGTNLKTLTYNVSTWNGLLINKLTINKYALRSSYLDTITATPVLGPGDSRVQSVYLKSAGSTSTNFAYLDPSTIGSSTATPVINDANWDDPEIPRMFKIGISQGGNISTATYKFSMRKSFGFYNNFFDNERPISLNNIFMRYGDIPNSYTPNRGNTYNNRQVNIKRVDNKHILTFSTSGITIANVYDSSFVNFDSTTTPALNSTAIQDAIPMPDGSILIATTDAGLLKLSSDRTVITKFTGIGTGVTENTCYCVAVKFNGDIWAVFEGAIAKYSNATSTWTIYNSTTPITFIHSEYNPTWNNTLAIYCRKDAAADEILLTRLNSNALTWWSPASPTPVNTGTNSATSINKFTTSGTTPRGDYSRLCQNLPGTSNWFIPNYNNNIVRMTFGTNSATTVSAYTHSSTYPAVLIPMQKNGNWIIRSYENPQSTSTVMQMREYDSTSLLTSENRTNVLYSLGSSQYMSEILDEYGTGIFVYMSGSSLYNVHLYNPFNPFADFTWENYGWNSGTGQWELDNPNGKPVHNALADLPHGLKLGFNPTGTNDFITGERWIGYLFNGLHKDNSTSATFSVATHARGTYTTTDLSATTVPAAGYGSTTENVSMYTLDNTAYSWNGGVSSRGIADNTIASGPRSELVITGDFTYNFYSNQFAQNTNASQTTCYMSMYERDAATVTSKWAFQFRFDGFLVAEDDVTKTTRTLPGTNNKYTIKRVGSTITYLVNDVLVYTSTITSANPLRVLVRMPNSDTTRMFYDMKVTYNESRRVLKIGNSSNQTGVYDTRYAMIEAFVTTPRTTAVTLNGVPATIITDPVGTPAAGQVLLLQKSGMLVFNPADAGKTVTCSALVMLET